MPRLGPCPQYLCASLYCVTPCMPTLRSPAVLIITHQCPLGLKRQGRLPRTCTYMHSRSTTSACIMERKCPRHQIDAPCFHNMPPPVCKAVDCLNVAPGYSKSKKRGYSKDAFTSYLLLTQAGLSRWVAMPGMLISQTHLTSPGIL